VIGDPIGHSLSPRLHEAAIRSAGLDVRYDAVQVPPARLADFVAEARRGAYRGFNVTIPHKEAIVPLLDGLAEEARRLGAVNTVVCGDGVLRGFNTDVAGFTRALGRAIDKPPARALVLGAGGAARAIVWALTEMGASVRVSGRTETHARQIAEVIPGVETTPWERRTDVAARCDLVVNATPLGMSHLADQSPLPAWPGPDGGLAFDLVYGRVTPFMKMACAAGWQVMDGTEMLVQQAAEAFRLWFGIVPNLAAMQAACTATENLTCSAS
jgi:shikimate dehydrogenase